MSDNAEEGIARVQTAGIQGAGTREDQLRRYQKRTIAYLDDRILIYVLAVGCIALMLVWATAQSMIIQLGSLALVIALTVLWGVARLKRIERLRQERERASSEWE